MLYKISEREVLVAQTSPVEMKSFNFYFILTSLYKVCYEIRNSLQSALLLTIFISTLKNEDYAVSRPPSFVLVDNFISYRVVYSLENIQYLVNKRFAY